MAWRVFNRINKELIPMKAHYFWYSAAEVIIQPNLVTFLLQLGASATEIGVIYTVLPFALMIWKPAMGSIADRFQKLRLCAIICLLITIVTYFVIIFTPKTDRNHSINTFCNSTGVHLDFCDIYPYNSSQPTNSTCTLSCPESNLSSKFTISGPASSTDNHFCCSMISWNSEISCLEDSSLDCIWECENELCSEGISMTWRQKVYIVIFMVVSYSFEGAAISLSDTMTVEMLGKNYDQYGKSRLFSSIGYGIFSIVIGAILDSEKVGENTYDLSMCFYLMALFYFLSGLSLVFARDVKFERPKSIFKEVLLNFRLLDNILFAAGCFMLGIYAGITWTFLIVFMGELEAGKLTQGLALAVEGFGGEVLVLLVSGYILRKIGSQFCLTIVFAAYCVRFLAYSFIWNPQYILPVELTEGFCFGLLMPALTTRACLSVDPNVAATMQGMLQGIYEGIGVGVGGIIGGLLYDSYGSHETWRILGISSGICCIVHFVLAYLISRYNPKATYNEEIE